MPRLFIRKAQGTAWGLTLRKNVTDYPQGAYVHNISEASPMKHNGLKEGDVIVSFNGHALAPMDMKSIQELFMVANVADIDYLSQPLPQSSGTAPLVSSRSATTPASSQASRPSTLNNTDSRSAPPPVIDLISSSEDEDDDDEDPEDGDDEEIDDDETEVSEQRFTHTSRRISNPFASGSSSNEVIDLVSDDDEPPRQAPRLSETSTPSASQRVNSKAVSTTVQKTPSAAGPSAPAVVPNIPVFTSVPVDGPITYPYKRKHGKIEIKVEYEPKGFGEANIGDEVVELPNPDAEKDSDGGEAVDIDDDEDIQIIGEKMTVASDMPHQREACTKKTFKYNGTKGNQVNMAHCPNCYCYVCEVKASECMDWSEHCNANCRDVKWKQLRSTHNTPMMKLLSPAQKASFLKKYERLFNSAQNSHYGGYGDSDEESDDGYGHMFNYGHNIYAQREKRNSDTITTCVNSIRSLLTGEGGNKIATEGSSSAGSSSTANTNNNTPADDFMEASALLIRLLGLSNLYAKMDSIKSLLVQWVVNPLYTTSLHDALKKTLEQNPNNFGQTFTRGLLFLPSFLKDPNGKREQMKTDILGGMPSDCLKHIFLRVIDQADSETIRQIVEYRGGGSGGSGDTSMNIMLLFVIAKSITLQSLHRLPMVEQILISMDESILNGHLRSESSTFAVDNLTLLKIVAIAMDMFRSKRIPAIKVGSVFIPLLRKVKNNKLDTNTLCDELNTVRNTFHLNPLIVSFLNGNSSSMTWLYTLLSSPSISASTPSSASSTTVVADWRDSLQFAMAFLCIFSDMQVVSTSPQSSQTPSQSSQQNSVGLHTLANSLKKVASVEQPLACWLCGNVLASWFYPKINRLSSQQVVAIMDSTCTLMSFFFNASLGKSHLKFYSDLHPWIIHNYTRMPTITTTNSTASASCDYLIQYRLSNVPDVHFYQLAAKESNKVGLVKEIFRPLGNFSTNRQYVIGNFLAGTELLVMVKLITSLIGELRNISEESGFLGHSSSSSNMNSVNGTNPIAINTLYQNNRNLFLMVWKSLYMNLFADSHSVGTGTYWSDAMEKFTALFRYLKECKSTTLDWKKLADEMDQTQALNDIGTGPRSIPLGTDLERRIFFHSLGILQDNCVSPQGLPFGSSSVKDVVKLKKDVIAFAQLLQQDVNRHSQLPSYEIAMRLAIENFYLTSREATSTTPTASNATNNLVGCLWDEWRIWSGLVCYVVRHNNDDRMITKLAIEDFTDLSSLGHQWLKLNQFTVEDIDWSAKNCSQNLVRVAKALQDHFTNSASQTTNPLTKTKEVGMHALSKPDSILSRCLRYLTLEYLQRHANEINPIVHKVIAELYFATANSSIHQTVFKFAVDEMTRKHSLFAAKIAESNATQIFDLIQSMSFLGQVANIPTQIKSKESLKVICDMSGKARKAVYGTASSSSTGSSSSSNQSGETKNVFTILMRQVLLNIQGPLMGGFISAFEDSIREFMVNPAFRDQMADVIPLINNVLRCATISTSTPTTTGMPACVTTTIDPSYKAADVLHLALFKFYFQFDEVSFVEFWSLLCEVVRSEGNSINTPLSGSSGSSSTINAQHFTAKVSQFCDLMKTSTMPLTAKTWKTQWQVMYHMKGLDNFLQYVVNDVSVSASASVASSKDQYTVEMIEQLIYVLIERVYQHNMQLMEQYVAYQDLLLMAIGKCLLALPGVDKALRALLRTLSADGGHWIQSTAQPSPVEFSAMTMTRPFAQLMIQSLQDTNKMPENVRMMTYFAFYSTCKDEIFACLSDPGDPGVTLSLMLSNRMFAAIGDYLKKRVEIVDAATHNKTSPVGLNATSAIVRVQSIAIAMDMLSSLLKPAHFMPVAPSGTSSSNATLVEESVLIELHSPNSLLRTLYKCCAYLQMRYCASEESGQQPIDCEDLRTALNTLKKIVTTIMKPCVKHSKLISYFVECFANIFRVVDFCEQYQSFVNSHTEILLGNPNVTNSDGWNILLTDILHIGEDANYKVLLRYVLTLLKLRSPIYASNKKLLLEYLVQECANEDHFADFIGSFFSKPCVEWQSQNGRFNKEYRIQDGLIALTHRYHSPANTVVKDIDAFVSSSKAHEALMKPLAHSVMMLLLGFNPYHLPAADRSITTTTLADSSMPLQTLFIGQAESTKHHYVALLRRIAKLDSDHATSSSKSSSSGQSQSQKAMSAMLAALAKAYNPENHHNPSIDLNALFNNVIQFQHERGGFTWLFLMIAWLFHGCPNSSYGRTQAPSQHQSILVIRLILFNHNRNPKVFPAIIHQYLLTRLKMMNDSFYWCHSLALVDAVTSPLTTVSSVSKHEILGCPEILDFMMLQHANDSNSTLDAYLSAAPHIVTLCVAKPNDASLLSKFLKVLMGIAETARSSTMDARKRSALQSAVDTYRTAKNIFAQNGFADQLQATKLQMIKIVKSKKPVAAIMETL